MEPSSDPAAALDDAADAAAAPPIYFRARAKRQTTRYRQRSADQTKAGPSGSSSRSNDEDKEELDEGVQSSSPHPGDGASLSPPPPPPSPPFPPSLPSPSAFPSAFSVADLNIAATALRLRKKARQGRLRGTGLYFSSEYPHDDARVDVNAAALVPVRAPDAAGDIRGHITDRFTHQTGLIADLHDRHMTEYIESRLYSGYAAPRPEADHASLNHGDDDIGNEDGGNGLPSAFSVRTGDQPTKHGKLFEVAIPADIRNRREDAKRRLAEMKQQPKLRSGRNRRGSDDIKRDQFVEQFLRENRLNVYEVPSRPPPAHSSSAPAHRDYRTADDRMADQFRRQYLEELSRRRQRRRHTRPARQPPPPGDILRGPKLGGSRNSRAAIRNTLLQQEKERIGRKV